MKNLKDFQKPIRRLANALTMPAKAGKSLFEREKWIKRLKNCLNGIDLSELEKVVDDEHREVQNQIVNQLKARREEFLNRSREHRFEVERVDSYDRFDVLKVEYKGSKVVISLSNVKLLQQDLATGEEIFEACKGELEKLRNGPFDREQFFSQIKLAISFLRLAEPDSVSPDRSVTLRAVYPLMRLVKNYQSRKDISYKLAQFIYDLGRFLAGGVMVENYRVQMETPAQAFTREALIIPNLDNPNGIGKPVRKIKLVPIVEKNR